MKRKSCQGGQPGFPSERPGNDWTHELSKWYSTGEGEGREMNSILLITNGQDFTAVIPTLSHLKWFHYLAPKDSSAKRFQIYLCIWTIKLFFFLKKYTKNHIM